MWKAVYSSDLVLTEHLHQVATASLVVWQPRDPKPLCPSTLPCSASPLSSLRPSTTPASSKSQTHSLHTTGCVEERCLAWYGKHQPSFLSYAKRFKLIWSAFTKLICWSWFKPGGHLPSLRQHIPFNPSRQACHLYPLLWFHAGTAPAWSPWLDAGMGAPLRLPMLHSAQPRTDRE